ncbi:DUF2987 domain-containing protein [Vibrio methylphosphonaticus]|uniref:DUF2987 domain-containing protein n=1 Tax=Vibrio methylphosphonaticus TaxID=2946866 RepID=UPI00202A96D9|nr:DUF2987 domain-containing protein [Vibrio methylphosphonaticus]MCL9776800.1 DUF2987 domain-containing protein [Vibrio methylphosphonaticus]
MKKAANLALLGLIAGVLAMPATAQEYRFTYSKLYSQMKNNIKEGHEDVKVGFFFVDAQTQQLCTIDKAWMEKEEKYEELKTSKYNELLVPLDGNLKQANPLVYIQTPPMRQCDFSMVVMTKEPLAGKVSYQDIANLLPQMQTMLTDLGGMFSGWFTADVAGLTLEFAELSDGRIELSDGAFIEISDGKAQVLLEQIDKNGFMQLPAKTSRVLPYIPSAN